MRRYMQGTLDFACGVYAVINALSLTHALDLAGARLIFRETHADISAHPALWADYAANATDHYWLVRYMIERWCSAPPYKLSVRRPFGEEDGPPAGDLSAVSRHLPERLPPAGPRGPGAAEREAEKTWQTCTEWLGGKNSAPRAIIMRFHRFVPSMELPIVSHWTTGKSVEDGVLHLHDASSEPRALLALSKDLLLPFEGWRASVRIVPESVLLLEKS